jgi:hypothetical protein
MAQPTQTPQERKTMEQQLLGVVQANNREPGILALRKLLEINQQKQMASLLQCLPADMLEQRATVWATQRLLKLLEDKNVLPS